MGECDQGILGSLKMTEILSPAQLKRLSEHKYSSLGSSITEPVMQIFWRWLVELLPRSWAPNSITLVGLVINVVTSLIVCYYSTDAKSPIPAWALLTCALGLFIYQTLDALDGKQARRTNTSSPLGEMFDHGCDSISTVFVTLASCSAMYLGTNLDVLFFECFSAIALFYLAHWQNYVTGTLRFAIFDVTEAQFSIMFIYIVSAIFGASFWTLKVPVIGLEMKIVMVLFSVAVAAITCHQNFTIIFMKGGIGKNGATVADTSVVFPAFPIGAVILLALMIYKKSTTQIFENHPCLYILSFGLVAAKITNKLVVAHMTKSEMSFLDSALIGPGMLFFNQYFNTLVNEYYVLVLCCLYSTVDIVRYSASVCIQICEYLDIYCFKMKVQPDDDNIDGDDHADLSADQAMTTRRTTRSVAKKSM
ncbi:choline/ethanolaminephosphotransferase 1-like isoform X1 [Lineus longissimus]|uniref:choline/ethanolaminephosphotransferase 1-like isoform X1 n=1 Tax=Lineus longissimus TaxID=88925 RepID=UPI002B4E7CB3